VPETRRQDAQDQAPIVPPRTITIYVEAGQDPVVDADGFAEYERSAVLYRAWELSSTEEDEEEEEEDG